LKHERQHALSLIAEACAAGARLSRVCEQIGLSTRTVQRYQRNPDGEDQRRGPKTTPKNKLSDKERASIIAWANSPEYRNMSPKQIVPLLADKKIYIASESTFYRVLKAAKLMKHRASSQPKRHVPPPALRATGPNQVYSWDITYLRSPVRGQFYYLYAFIDVWSRKLVGYRVETHESTELAASLISQICAREGVSKGDVRLHSDNGSPMKGATLLATLQDLGVVPSFSRPRVSDDNPYSEALFRTVKYRPEYPSKAFESLEHARSWVKSFTRWYNTEHLHSGINFVTPESRHRGDDLEILKQREQVYQRARSATPSRWSGACRDWNPAGAVVLNGPNLENENRSAS